MAMLEIQLAPEQSLPLGSRISFELITTNADGLAKSLQDWPDIKVSKLDDATLLIEMIEQALYAGNVSAKHSKDSFVIDISEPSIKAFVANFSGSRTQSIDLNALVAYVSQHIDKPSYVNGFDIASVVATSRSGDCTEYAVLLTALARSLGLPARVIIGTILVEEKAQVLAVGHAWVEVWQEDKWHILDAAMYQSGANKHFYLPAAALEKESPGYAMSLASATVLMPSSIRALQTAN
ncbi:transglutaminase family protein [Glaciecola sp. SC05]|uniref:transglutaminase-like domain-containing protein n=1 Tax=Glaciecola sp. SC05 TaxID=1987355 RepID=UPI003528D78A